MAQTIRITITPDVEKALQILRQSTLGTLNTTELIKMAIGVLADQKKKRLSQSSIQEASDKDIGPQEWDRMSAQQFFKWAKEDGSLKMDNISQNAKLKPFVPEPYVSNH